MIPLLSIYGVVGHTKPKTVELGTSQKLERKSNFWGVFIMKLTYEDKVQIYEIKKQGFSYSQLSDMFGIDKSSLK